MSASHTQHVSRDETARRPRRRRRWLLAFGLLFGTLIGATLVVSAIVWLRMPKYTATAYFQVASRQPVIAFESAQDDTEREFQIYKDTQAQLIKSTGVLTRALGEPDLASLPIVQRQKGEGRDPIEWLQDDLQVSFPGDGEIMEVSLGGNDPQELTRLLNAVVDAYQKSVVDVERHRRAARLDELDRIYRSRSEEVRMKMNQLQQLANQVGAGDSEALKLKQEVALRRLSDVRTEYYRIQTQLELTRGAMKAQQTLVAIVDTMPIPRADVEDYVASHPLMRELSAQLAGQIRALADSRAAAKRDAASPYVDKRADQAFGIQAQMDALGTEVEGKLREKKRSQFENEIRRLEAEIEALAGREQGLAKEVQQQEKAIEQVSRPSIDLEIQQSEVQSLKESLDQIGRARERLRLELQAPSRVTLVEPAVVKR